MTIEAFAKDLANLCVKHQVYLGEFDWAIKKGKSGRGYHWIAEKDGESVQIKAAIRIIQFHADRDFFSSDEPKEKNYENSPNISFEKEVQEAELNFQNNKEKSDG